MHTSTGATTSVCVQTHGPRAAEASKPETWHLRDEVRPEDAAAVRDIVASTGFFRPDEVEVAVELVTERLARGDASGYHFVLMEDAGQVAGYACYGPIACTVGSFDLFWIAVHESRRGLGLGRVLMREAEARIAAMGGRRVYVETSGKAQYAPTRAFYEKFGYRQEARFAEFYDVGDDKVVYVRVLETTERPN